MSLRGVGVDLRCHCIETESRRIGKHIESVELFPPSPHCKDTEIMWVYTLKMALTDYIDPDEYNQKYGSYWVFFLNF